MSHVGSSPGRPGKHESVGKQPAASGSAGTVDVSAKTFDLQAVQWLRTQRAVISTSRQHTGFQRELRALEADLKARPGATVLAAIGITLGMIVLAIAAVVLGAFLMDLAANWMGSLSESS